MNSPDRFLSAKTRMATIVCATFSFIFFLSAELKGQDFKHQYRDAKDLFKKEDYIRAMDAFKPLIVYDKNNPYSEYASFYYGYCAYKVGFASVAKDIFLQTRKLHPDWDQIDELNYLLAKIFFDQRDYFQALWILKDIKSLSVAGDIPLMKRHYFYQISDPETLALILEEYPDEPDAARALAHAIVRQPLPEQNITLFDSLVTRFGFDRADFVNDEVLVSKKKERYRVGLLLPFLSGTLEPTPIKKRNQFVLDLYNGIRMAADTLEAQGVHLDLYAYDTDLTDEVTREVLGEEELKDMDLLVGPLFQDQAKAVLEFSEKNKITVINPVSNNSEFLGKNPFALLFQPSNETLGARSAELAFLHARKKNCIVYFGESPKDSVRAFNFMLKARDLGIRIVKAEEIHREISSDIFETLATATEYDEFKIPTQFKLKRDSIGCIYVASDDQLIYSKVTGGVETRGDSILVIGNENWIATENSSVEYGIYERIPAVLESPNFIPVDDPHYQDFRKKYVQRHGLLPSDYAWIGYRFMDAMGKALQKYGIYFQTALARDLDVSEASCDYSKGRDNGRIPYVYFKSGVLVSVKEQ
jgi:hypothetical protein